MRKHQSKGVAVKNVSSLHSLRSLEVKDNIVLLIWLSDRSDQMTQIIKLGVNVEPFRMWNGVVETDYCTIWIIQIQFLRAEADGQEFQVLVSKPDSSPLVLTLP